MSEYLEFNSVSVVQKNYKNKSSLSSHISFNLSLNSSCSLFVCMCKQSGGLLFLSVLSGEMHSLPCSFLPAWIIQTDVDFPQWPPSVLWPLSHRLISVMPVIAESAPSALLQPSLRWADLHIWTPACPASFFFFYPLCILSLSLT